MAKKSLTLAELVVNITAKSAAFNNELKKTNRKTQNWAADTRKHVNAAGKAFAGMGVVAAGGLAVIYKQASANIDNLGKQSVHLGITTEKLGGLRHAADIYGISQEKMDSSFERMVKRMGEAELGIGASKVMLEKYGLATDDFFGKAPDAQFNELADTIAGMTTSQEQAAFAAAMFGREGVSLVNMAMAGSKGIKELSDEAKELGLTLNNVDVAKVEAANDAMTRASAAFKGFSNSFTVEMAPMVAVVADMFTDATKGSNGFRDEVINGLEGVVMAFGYVGNAIRGIEIIFKGAQLVVTAFVSETNQLINTAATGWLEVFNLFAPESMQIDPSKTALAIIAQESIRATNRLKAELHDLANQDLPSGKVAQFFNEIREKSQQAAEKIVLDAKIIANAGTGDAKTITPFKIATPEIIQGLNDVELAIMDSYDRQDATALDQFTKNQEKLDEARQSRLANHEESLVDQEEYEQKSAALKEAYEAQKEKTEASRRQVHINGTKTFFADISTLSKHGNKNLAAIGKAAAKINIGISTTEAAMHAYKWAAQWGGPAAGAIAAGAAVTAGLMRLRELESGGSSGDSGGLSGASTFDQALPNQAVSPPVDSATRGEGQTIIQQTIEIKALDGASVQEVVNNNKEIFLSPVLERIEETGGI